jgi:hypothetical protein
MIKQTMIFYLPLKNWMDSDKDELAFKLEKQDPSVINQFKEVLMNILISYFKNNIVLLNNLVEISEKIIIKRRSEAFDFYLN